MLKDGNIKEVKKVNNSYKWDDIKRAIEKRLAAFKLCSDKKINAKFKNYLALEFKHYENISKLYWNEFKLEDPYYKMPEGYFLVQMWAGHFTRAILPEFIKLKELYAATKNSKEKKNILDDMNHLIDIHTFVFKKYEQENDRHFKFFIELQRHELNYFNQFNILQKGNTIEKRKRPADESRIKFVELLFVGRSYPLVSAYQIYDRILRGYYYKDESDNKKLALKNRKLLSYQRLKEWMNKNPKDVAEIESKIPAGRKKEYDTLINKLIRGTLD